MSLCQPFHFTLPLALVHPSMGRDWAEWVPPSEGTEWTRLWEHQLEGELQGGDGLELGGQQWQGGGEGGRVTWEDQGEQPRV